MSPVEPTPSPLNSASQASEAEVRRSLLHRSGLLEPGSRPELDRWTAVLRRATGAAVAASGRRARRPHAGRRAVGRRCRRTRRPPSCSARSPSKRSSATRSTHRRGPTDCTPTSRRRSPSTARSLCMLGVADAAARDWDARDLQILDDTTAAIAAEIRLRLANDEALRFHDLVASHHRVHELIARGAPLKDVLVELVEGIERHDPSVTGCVVLLDRESSTLHPGAGPSLPPHYLAAIDGVVIGPNVGSLRLGSVVGPAHDLRRHRDGPEVGADPRLRARRGSSALLVDADQGRRRRGARHASRCTAPSPAPAAARAPHADGGRGPPGRDRHRAPGRSERLIHDARTTASPGCPTGPRSSRCSTRRSSGSAGGGARGAVRRPRRAQGAERHARPRPRRRDDPGDRPAPVRRRCAERLRRSLRRRRVRRRRRGGRRRRSGGQARLPPARGDLPARCPGSTRASVTASIGIALSDRR